MGALYGQILNDWQANVDPRAFASAFMRMQHRGIAGKRGWHAPGAALGWHSSGTPSDQAVDGQPWLDRDLVIAFDGTLSNQSSLQAQLSLPANARRAAVLVAGWRRFGDRLINKLEGGFVLVVIDLSTRQVTLARDVLGMRGLCYRQNAQGLCFASEECALLEPKEAVSDAAVARYFAARAPQTGNSFFEAIKVLPPGGVLTLRAYKWQLTRSPFPHRSPINKISETEALTEYRRLLDQAISRSLIDAVPRAFLHRPAGSTLGVSLSGGLDSNVLAALVQKQLAANGRQLRALTWGFDQIPQCDESALASAHAKMAGMAWQRIPVDAFFPLAKAELRPVSRNTPIANIYREIKSVLYRVAQAQGIRCLINGHFGDHLFADPAEWLSDEFARGNLAAISTEYFWRARQDWRLWRDPALRRAGRRMLRLPLASAARMPELTAEARALIRAAESSVKSARGPRARQVELNLGDYAGFESYAEAEFADPFGVQVITPYRDVELTAFMLALPSSLSNRRGEQKWLAREALKELLPEAIHSRAKSSSLQPFLDQAMATAARTRFELLLFSPLADWPRFLDRATLTALWQKPQRTDRESALLWYCAGYELWRAALREPYAK